LPETPGIVPTIDTLVAGKVCLNTFLYKDIEQKDKYFKQKNKIYLKLEDHETTRRMNSTSKPKSCSDRLKPVT